MRKLRTVFFVSDNDHQQDGQVSVRRKIWTLWRTVFLQKRYHDNIKKRKIVAKLSINSAQHADANLEA